MNESAPAKVPQLKHRWLYWLIIIGGAVGCVVTAAMAYMILWWLPD